MVQLEGSSRKSLRTARARALRPASLRVTWPLAWDLRTITIRTGPRFSRCSRSSLAARVPRRAHRWATRTMDEARGRTRTRPAPGLTRTSARSGLTGSPSGISAGRVWLRAAKRAAASVPNSGSRPTVTPRTPAASPSPTGEQVSAGGVTTQRAQEPKPIGFQGPYSGNPNTGITSYPRPGGTGGSRSTTTVPMGRPRRRRVLRMPLRAALAALGRDRSAGLRRPVANACRSEYPAGDQGRDSAAGGFNGRAGYGGPRRASSVTRRLPETHRAPRHPLRSSAGLRRSRLRT